MKKAEEKESKKEKKQNQENESSQAGQSEDSQQPTVQPLLDDYDNSAIYRKDPKTGRWIVQNPAGSTGYNYLYRDPTE